MQGAVPIRVQLGPFEFDLKTGDLSKGRRKLRLQEQPFQILLMLVERSGELVTREEIKKKLWPNDTVVEFDHSIHAAINRLRQALGDSADSPRYVETVARRGYRLMVPVDCLESTPADGAARAETPSSDDVAAATSLTAPAGLTGRTVSHYRVLDIIGGGGMGVVYRAEDLKLGRAVALKFLPEELGSDPQALERFSREARAASSLDHPNICSIFEFGEHEGRPFIVMQLLEGQTLRDWLAAASPGERIGLDELLNIGVQVADGLKAAHERGIIHRDIKPANVFITNNGVAKILDFGLVKLLEAGEHDELEAKLDDQPAAVKSKASSVGLTLTRTGVAMGTAGYMSPEQVRGEKLDARTDLFSVGLVLYEMATGQRAFSGETAAIVHDAILNHTPVPVRELNSTLSPKLEHVINHALEKDRERRYQSAAKLRAELELLATPVKGRWRLRMVAALALLLIVLGGTLVRLITRRPPRPELKETQLTANSPENQVENGVVSRDGRQIAFYDMRGMHVQLLETGETVNIPEPESLKDAQVDWGLVQVSNTRLLANAYVLGQQPSIWILSIMGGQPNKLRDNAEAEAPSPDGSSIAFLTGKGQEGYRELWLMDTDGSNPRKIVTADPDSNFEMVDWSPDGRRLIYRRDYAVGDKVNAVLETRDLGGGSPTTLLADQSLWNFVWLPDGRLIYVLISSKISSSSCDFWGMRVDPRTGKPQEIPTRLTNWASFCIGSLSATGDGKRLVFNKWWASQTIYMDDFDRNSTDHLNPHRLTLTDSVEYPVGWTANSKEVVLLSKRTGKWGYFRHVLGEEQEQTVAADAGGLAKGSMSPDHQWILFICCQEDRHFPSGATVEESLRLMRVPVTGGTPQTILNLHTFAEPINRFAGRYLQPPSCAVAPANLCVMAERTSNGRQLVFSSFDLFKGRGQELLRYTIEPTASYKWALSPDGTRLAVFARSEDRIHFLPLNGQAPSELKVKGWNVLQTLYWAPDAKGLFVASVRKRNSVLLYVDLHGNAKDIWELPGEQDGGGDVYAIPSPDGRHLAIRGWNINSNMWMLENF